jgi:hypothetical protein
MRKRTSSPSATMGGYNQGWVAASGRVKRLSPAVCPSCGARLSVYRMAGEEVCAPCRRAAALPPSAHHDGRAS